MSQLPKGWAKTPLSEIVASSLGGDWGKDCDGTLNGYTKVRVVRGTDFKEWKTRRAAKAAERCIKQSSLVSRQLAEGDIVVEVSGGGPTQPVGRSIMIDKATFDNSALPLVCSNFFRRVRLHEPIESAYVKNFLSHAYAKGQFDEFQTQTTNLRNLNFKKFLEGVIIDLPPLNEQRRIIAKLEKLLIRVDTAQARLATILRILKRFRQSVLNAASSGRLTADWRETITQVEPAAKFLKRIQVDRRSLWEKVELRKKGVKSTENNWRKKYKEPILTEETEPNGLPQFWKRERLDSALAYIEAGKSFKCVERPPLSGEVGVLKVSAVSWGEFDEHESKTCINKKLINPDIQVRVGDFLFSRANTIELVGACVLVNKVSSKVMLSDKTLRLHIAGLLPRYVLYTLRSSSGRAEIERLATGNQNSMRNIGQERIREILIPVPPLAEQQEIVRRVEALFKTADALEARYYKAKAHVDKLTQSILAKAFRGELVPQSPNDEPASTLLERIAEKHCHPNNTSRTTRKTKNRSREARPTRGINIIGDVL